MTDKGAYLAAFARQLLAASPSLVLPEDATPITPDGLHARLALLALSTAVEALGDAVALYGSYTAGKPVSDLLAAPLAAVAVIQQQTTEGNL